METEEEKLPLIDQKQSLLRLARIHFEKLSYCDEKLLQSIAEGRVADLEEEYAQKSNELSESELNVNANLLAWICKDSHARVFLTYEGIRIFGATIEGEFDINDTSVSVPLILQNCVFNYPLKFVRAKLRTLDLSGSEVPELVADLIQVEGSIYYRKLIAKGKVSLIGASIGGSFYCDGGKFLNQQGSALVGDRAKIAGDVCLSDGYEAKGRVSFIGASIGGDFKCSGGKFLNQQGEALNADRVKVDGSVLLNEGFEVYSILSFLGSYIDNDFICCRSTIAGKLNLFCAKISGYLYLTEIRYSEVGLFELDLRFTQAKVLADDESAWPDKGHLFLEGFIYEAIYAPLPYAPSSRRFKRSSRLEWLKRQPQGTAYGSLNHFSLQPYNQLAQVLKTSGHEAEAIKVLIKKEEDRRKYGGLRVLARCWNRILGLTIAHGYKPHRALVPSIIIVVVGSFIFGAGYPSLILPSDLTSSGTNWTVPIPNEQGYPAFNRWMYSLDVFLPIIDFHQEKHWLPSPNMGKTEVKIPLILIKVPISGKFLLYYFWLHIVAGWILTTLWVAGFTGLVRSRN